MELVQRLTGALGARDAARGMDAEMARRAEEVRRRRFAQLTAEHRAMLLGVAMRFCSRDRAVADDLVQDAYERAWRNFDSLQDAAKVRPWLVKILHNGWIDACRKRVRDLPVAEVPEEPVVVEEPSPWQRITIDDLRLAIDRLAEPYRTVAILHDIEHRPNAEIANRLEIPYATVATRLHRAHRLLQQLLKVMLDDAREDES